MMLTAIGKNMGKEGVQMIPETICPKCKEVVPLDETLTAQSNQNVIYTCPRCEYTVRNIETSKG
ncbi:hypothetical protein LC040_04235 [Bacillus tianshenii]|nr:hypothetical protein LC040_04235 [Bacillus tianshenii]